MCECLSIMMAPWSKFWRSVFIRLCFKSPLIYPAIEVGLPEGGRLESPQAQAGDGFHQKTSGKSCRNESGKCTIYVLKSKHHEKSKDVVAGCKAKKKAAKMVAADNAHTHEPRSRYASNGGSNTVSLFTKQGLKGINQDAMLVWKKFASQEDTVFCGVFDGHGSDGHLVARNVRDILPQKLASLWQSQQQAAKEIASSSDDSGTDILSQRESGFFGEFAGDPYLITAWKDSFVNAYKLMDRELLINDHLDCVSSGTTAVTLVKQGNDLIVGNVGDSRAVLGTRADDDSILALQLTVDLKPNVPREAERIKRYKGRVFALRNEPLVHRVWLPHHNIPGLAMARALGDYCLKNYGVISEPEVTYRRLTKKDEFVVLATDGVWDVLSNEQVVEIVASAPDRSLSARVVVETAVHAWKSKHATSKVDDCAVVCLFL